MGGVALEEEFMWYLIAAVVLIVASYVIGQHNFMNAKGWLFVTLVSGAAACCLMTPQAQAVLQRMLRLGR